MPGKSRHKKGRHALQGARGRAAPVHPAAVTAEAPEPVRPAAPPFRSRAATAQAGTPAAPPGAGLAPAYIGRELRAVIILGGIVLVALIVASSLLR